MTTAERLLAAQAAERDARNRSNLRRWHVATFGWVAGHILYNEHLNSTFHNITRHNQTRLP